MDPEKPNVAGASSTFRGPPAIAGYSWLGFATMSCFETPVWFRRSNKLSARASPGPIPHNITRYISGEMSRGSLPSEETGIAGSMRLNVIYSDPNL